MKILIINHRYFISGGPERYLFNIIELLKLKGHDVMLFSVQNKFNLPSKYSKYFLSPIGRGDEIYAHEYNKKDIKTIVKVLGRLFYSFEAKKKIFKLLDSEKPDILYVLNYQNKISCSIIDAAYKRNIPIVQRISDFGKICSTNILYHYEKKIICEKCVEGSKINAIINKCVQNSYLNSIIKVVSFYIESILKIDRKISAYVIPSVFTITKFVAAGFSKEKIYHIPTYYNSNITNNIENIEYEDFLLYVGRVDPDKGIYTLIDAVSKSEYKLIIIGGTTSNYINILNKTFSINTDNIKFLGNLDFTKVSDYLKRCRATVVPSEWYDNFPNVILESYAFSKPVIASDIGSLKELVLDNYTGLRFKVKDSDDCLEKIKQYMSNAGLAKEHGNNGRQLLNEKYSGEIHYNKLMNVFSKYVKNDK